MTRLESAGFQVQRDWYPLDELAGSALNRLAAVLREHPIKTAIPDDLPLIEVDGVLIDEVLANLLENAARYTPRGSEITLRGSTAGDHVLVEVLDRGPGIEPGSEADIFCRFVRRRPATDRAGTGLGLAICAAVVRLHGGQIGVENRPDGGARFWFTIPLGTPPPMPIDAAPEATTLSPQSTAGGAQEAPR